MNHSALSVLIENLEGLCDKLGLSRAQLARRSGVAPRTVEYIFQTSRTGSGSTPNLDTVESIARALGVSTSQLLSPDLKVPDMPPHADMPLHVANMRLARDLSRLVQDFVLCPEAERAA